MPSFADIAEVSIWGLIMLVVIVKFLWIAHKTRRMP